MEFITSKVMFISLLIITIHSIETLAYATRLSGARVGLIASALSLFNVMVIISRTSNMIQQPYTGKLIDLAPAEGALEFVESQYRVIILSASIGTLIGILLLPTFAAVFSKAIVLLRKEGGSIPSLLLHRLRFDTLREIVRNFRFPKWSMLKQIDIRSVPIKFFMANMLITAIFTIGVLSSLYASLLVPERATTAIMASGTINGFATILLVLFIDPRISLLADEVRNKQGSYLKLRDMTAMMALSRLCGTILAQILFIPGAYYVAWVTKFF